MGSKKRVGTPEVIVDRFRDLRKAGIDGVLCTWIDVEAGLRKPFSR